MDIYTVDQISKKLQLCNKTVLKLIKNKELPAAKINNQYRITEGDLQDFLTSKK